MRVLHVITGLGIGGAELQLYELVRRSRHECEVVTLYNAGEVANMISGAGIPVHDLGMTSNTELSALFRLRALMRSGGFDAVHTHLYRSCVYGRIAARLAGVPAVVASEHSIGETHLERRRMSAGVRLLYLGSDLFSDTTIAVSDTVSARLRRWGLPARKLRVIPNGVDFDRVAFDPDARARTRNELGLAERHRVVGVLGRLDPNKRFDLLIESATPLLDEETRLLLVGDGPDRQRLEELAEANGVSDKVIFAGKRSDVASVLSALDLFVACSKQETFGLSVLEALANGLVVLYTTCPALDGVSTDRAIEVAGEVEELRSALLAELSAARPRTQVPELRELYGMDAVTERIDQLYDDLLSGRRDGRRVRQQGAVEDPASSGVNP
ncbi:Glycosyltransferase involved in cell wall bisynthesis [Actinopolyspora mzabensis]|uniref:Glycosyltransferase involved in cell wall bisynthesis n=1 Tax=Actinopolyspora mzabensis TaxID=995066 RepID=A0A1G8ZCE0_ACTMZ|nr:glycosyltransferase [Actinopolyspora mzabensis]SDK12776.1 Glycosyltransferase involved in cell wall bisynthesis [Actinopolyspora mzabensis]